MSTLTPKQLAALAAAVAAVTASAEARTLEQARKEVSEVMAGKVELLERSESPSIPQATVEKLQAELTSCGISVTGPRCLDGSAFADYGPLRGEVSKNNYITTSDGWVFFSRFQVKDNRRKENPYLVMAVRARKADTMPAFIVGNIYAIPAGRESQEAIKADFKQCDEALRNPLNTALTCPLNGFLSYEKMTDQGALQVLNGNTDAEDYRRFYHAAEVAFAAKVTATSSYARSVTRAIKARYSLVMDSGNAKYEAAFTQLLAAASKTAAYKDIGRDTALEMFEKAQPGSQTELELAVSLVNQNIATDRAVEVLADGFRKRSCTDRIKSACFPEALRKQAVEAYARAVPNKDEYVALLEDNDSVIRSAAYYVAVNKKVVLTNDNLEAIQKLLDHNRPNVRGNALAALSLIDTDEAAVVMAVSVQDLDAHVALQAFNKVEPRLAKLADKTDPRNPAERFTAVKFGQLVRNITVKAVPRNKAETDALNTLLAKRVALLAKLFKKARGVSGDAAMATQLATLSVSDDTLVRQDAARLLAGVAADSATSTILQLVTDDAVIVRNEALASLAAKSKLLTDAHVALLMQAANFTADANVRIKAVEYLGVIKSDLAQRALANKSTENLDANSATVRAAVAKALGGFVGTLVDQQATVTLIPMLVDSSKEVRDAAVAAMANRYLGDDMNISFVQTLSMYLSNADAEGVRNVINAIASVKSRYAAEILGSRTETFEYRPDVRLHVVQQLSANTSADASNALIGFIADSSAEVRAAVVSSLSIRSFNEANVEKLGSFVSRTDVLAEVRQNVAKLLGTTSSQRAYDLLVAQQKRETDSLVKAEIDAAIASILSRITPHVN